MVHVPGRECKVGRVFPCCLSSRGWPLPLPPRPPPLPAHPCPQVSGALAGRVLVGVSLPCAWERVAALAFGVRPGEPPTHTLYCEVMARWGPWAGGGRSRGGLIVHDRGSGRRQWREPHPHPVLRGHGQVGLG